MERRIFGSQRYTHARTTAARLQGLKTSHILAQHGAFRWALTKTLRECPFPLPNQIRTLTQRFLPLLYSQSCFANLSQSATVCQGGSSTTAALTLVHRDSLHIIATGKARHHRHSNQPYLSRAARRALHGSVLLKSSFTIHL